MIHGADYSDNNSTASTSGLDFVFYKATEGVSTVDDTFAPRWASINRNDIARGAYHFGWENESYSAQALHFVETVKPETGDILFLDFEAYPDKRNWGSMSWTELSSWVNNIIKEVKKLAPDNKVGLYCNMSDWNSFPSHYCGDFLFIADYSNSKPITSPAFTFWQYTDSPHDLDWGNFSDLEDLLIWSGKMAGLTAEEVWAYKHVVNGKDTEPGNAVDMHQVVDNIYNLCLSNQTRLEAIEKKLGIS